MVDAREYHERTKHSPRSVREDDFSLDHDNRPRPYKAYENLPREPLRSVRPPQPPTLSVIAEAMADPLSGAEQSPRATPDRETLATLCYAANGVVESIERQGRTLRFRAASCTGKLYHVDLYLVCGDCDGLSAGVYHFDPATFALDVVREGDYRGALADATGDYAPVADAPVTVAVTSTWWRNAWKYRDRTYRHAFWDSGTVLANLLGAAHALDYRAEVVAGFDDAAVADLLGVDSENEAPLELVPLGRDAPAPNAPPLDPIAPDETPLSSDPVDYPLIHDAWEQSALPDGDAAREWRGRCYDARGAGTRDAGGGERVALDPVDHETASARPFHATVRRRGSCREFDADEGPTRRQVGTVLDRATRGVPGDWNGGAAAGLAFNDAYVLAAGVDGVPDGTYQFLPETVEIERLGGVDRRTKRHLALDQSWAGDAHVNVYLLADVDELVGRLGNRGYRLAQLEAGVTLGRLYLATYAHRDLGGTGLTFYDDAVTDHLSPRAAGQTPTCLFAFGRRDD
ncbi:SagB/ThcOx family dehydrogenase [Halostella sp. JP-L12]|uniref:SagB family peptide dehydrogenase n=1 Tax=Halostella TaxID=1843185 RepID=UPI000EF81258|nr:MULTISPECIES: SagB family peptide dehydrogenase [Halostella]NHN47545.1 SagB/ThcOx family dehydrogenase [Halostella sp. JP-L12]